MQSKWYELRPKARYLRRRGYSLRHIEHRLGIPRSTLSGWLKHIQLTKIQSEKLQQDWKNALVKARERAIIWHNAQKKIRWRHAEREAHQVLRNIDQQDTNILELALAFLYLGEGSKKSPETAIGSSDPEILKFFLVGLKRVYRYDVTKIYCQLNLRADQNPEKMKKFWAKELKLPYMNFRYFTLDKRTSGIKTYPTYHGVCQLRCGNVAIQRRLVSLSKLFLTQCIQRPF